MVRSGEFSILSKNVLQGLVHQQKSTTCLVLRNVGNHSYISCDSLSQRCCDTGCCDRVFVLDKDENLWLSWIIVLIVSFLFSFTIICVKMLCKESCKSYTRDQTPIPFNNNDVQNGFQNQEERVLRRVVLLHVSNEDVTSPEEHLQLQNVNNRSTPPPPYEDVMSSQII